MNQTRLPLEGIRVIEFTILAAGPVVGKVLADFGAQSIVVETRGYIRARDGSRTPPPGARDPSSLNLGFFFNKFNTGKLSLTLNLRQEKGVEIVKRLVAKSDVVIDNFTPQVLERRGLGYDVLVKIKPDIIMLRMPTMGEGGPYRNHRSTSWNLLALAGLNCASGPADRPPVCPSTISLPDVSCNPLHGASAVLAALHYRAKTGKGQLIELSQYESALATTETINFGYLVNRQLPPRLGNRLEYAAPHGVYRCLGDDRWCAIAAFNQKEWEALCRVLGREDLLKDERFCTLLNRLRNADELDHLIEKWTIQRTAEEAMQLLQQAGVVAGIVNNVEDLVRRDPQLKARGHWEIVDHPEAGKLLTEGWGFRFSAMAARSERPPLLGEHNDYILGEVIGMSEEEINQFIVEGIID